MCVRGQSIRVRIHYILLYTTCSILLYSDSWQRLMIGLAYTVVRLTLKRNYRVTLCSDYQCSSSSMADLAFVQWEQHTQPDSWVTRMWANWCTLVGSIDTGTHSKVSINQYTATCNLSLQHCFSLVTSHQDARVGCMSRLGFKMWFKYWLCSFIWRNKGLFQSGLC